MGENEYGESGPFWPLVYFHSFEALNDAFEVQFSGLHFYTDTILDHAAQIFLKWNIVKQCL